MSDPLESFSSALNGADHKFDRVYQDIVAMQQSLSPQDFKTQIYNMNIKMNEQGLLDLDKDGTNDFIVFGVNNGNLLTGRPHDRMFQERDMNFNVVREGQSLPAMQVVDAQNPGTPDPFRFPFRQATAAAPEAGTRTPSVPNTETEPQPVLPPPDDESAEPRVAPGTSTDQPPAPPAPPSDQSTAPPSDQTTTPQSDQTQPAPAPEPAGPRNEQWGRREFSVNPDESAEYTIKSGDTVWAVSTDVLTKRLGRQPTNAEILQEVDRIANASQLANRDLIYPDNKLVIPPPGAEVPPYTPPARPEPQGNQRPNRPALPVRPTRDSPVTPRPEIQSLPEGESTTPGTGTPVSAQARDRWYIDQSKDTEFVGEWLGCGPTSLLMALSQWGLAQPTEANRRQLMRDTGTVADRRYPGDSRKMAADARARGLQAEVSLNAPDIEGMDKALSEGKTLIVNGSMYGARTRQLFPHFVYIAGKDAQGNYILGDPAQKGERTWTREQLRQFVTRGRPDNINPPGWVAVWR